MGTTDVHVLYTSIGRVDQMAGSAGPVWEIEYETTRLPNPYVRSTSGQKRMVEGLVRSNGAAGQLSISQSMYRQVLVGKWGLRG